MTETESPPGQVELESPGRLLRELRESRGMSLADVGQRLKYAARQIEAIEADDFARLPDRAFVRGMVRSYGRFLGADEGKLLSRLEKLQVSTPVIVGLPATAIPFPDGRKKSTRMYGLLSLLAVFIAFAVAFDLLPLQFLESLSKETPVVASSSRKMTDSVSIPQAHSDNLSVAVVAGEQTPLQAEVAITPPGVNDFSAASGKQEKGATGLNRKSIALRFERDSWVEIRQGDGKVLLSQLNPAGTRQAVEGSPPFTLIIGNAPNVSVFYNNQPVDLRPYFKVDVARFTLE